MDECPKCKDAWDRARAEYEAGGSPPSPPVVCPHMTQQTPEQVASNIIDKYTSPRIPDFNLRDAIAAAIREEREKAAACAKCGERFTPVSPETCDRCREASVTKILAQVQDQRAEENATVESLLAIRDETITTLREKAAALGEECRAARKLDAMDHSEPGTFTAKENELAREVLNNARARTDAVAAEYVK